MFDTNTPASGMGGLVNSQNTLQVQTTCIEIHIQACTHRRPYLCHSHIHKDSKHTPEGSWWYRPPHTVFRRMKVGRHMRIHCNGLHSYTSMLCQRKGTCVGAEHCRPMPGRGEKKKLQNVTQTCAVCPSVHTIALAATGAGVISQYTTVLTAQRA